MHEGMAVDLVSDATLWHSSVVLTEDGERAVERSSPLHAAPAPLTAYSVRVSPGWTQAAAHRAAAASMCCPPCIARAAAASLLPVACYSFPHLHLLCALSASWATRETADRLKASSCALRLHAQHLLLVLSPSSSRPSRLPSAYKHRSFSACGLLAEHRHV
jgi:hypothetical protein